MGIFRCLRTANFVVCVQSDQKLNISKILCISSLSVTLKVIISTATEKKWTLILDIQGLQIPSASMSASIASSPRLSGTGLTSLNL